MMTNTFGIVCVVFALILFIPSLLYLRRISVLWQWLKASAALTGIAAGTTTLILAYDLSTYLPLEEREAVARVAVEQLNPQSYQVTVYTEENSNQYVLSGDYWQIDAKIVRIHPSFDWLDSGSSLRLDRLSGRYQNIEQELNEQRSVFELNRSVAGIDLWAIATQFENFPGIEAKYGVANFMPLADGARFKIIYDQQSLISVPVNESAKQATRKWQ